MTQRIGNVGVLNIENATAESIKEIERIENVGMVLYRKETAHLLTQLNIGNLGSSIEVPEGHTFFNGNLFIDNVYIESISEPTYLFVNGNVIFDKNIQSGQLKKELQLIINGKIYVPSHLSGAIFTVIKKGNGNVSIYENTLPRIENGVFNLSNSFLLSIEEPQWLVVNGVLSFENNVDMEMFESKINNLEVNGIISLYQDQESALYKKVTSLSSCRLEVIPNGYEVVKKSLRLNARSIRRFTKKNLYTKKPLIIESDVTREMLTNAITSIQSKSVIICHEQLEDLIYELSSLLETEVLAYEQSFLMIEGDELWSNDQFLALSNPTNFIVKGQLTIDSDVTEEVLLEKIASIDILGQVIVPEKKLKGSLQKVIRVCTGTIEEVTTAEEGSTLKNIGELSL